MDRREVIRPGDAEYSGDLRCSAGGAAAVVDLNQEAVGDGIRRFECFCCSATVVEVVAHHSRGQCECGGAVGAALAVRHTAVARAPTVGCEPGAVIAGCAIHIALGERDAAAGCACNAVVSTAGFNQCGGRGGSGERGGVVTALDRENSRRTAAEAVVICNRNGEAVSD